MVAAGADVDVRGHVHQVTGTGRERGQRVGLRQRAFWRGRGFDRVNVVVHRANVARIAGEHAFEFSQQAWGEFGGRTIGAPIGPRRQVHQRLGIQGGGVVIFREPVHDLRHRSGVGLIQRFAIGRRWIGIAQRQRFDQRAIGGACRTRVRQRALRQLCCG